MCCSFNNIDPSTVLNKCPECQTFNLITSQKCRKCGAKLPEEKNVKMPQSDKKSK
jgi:ribosomal protein L40E